MRGVHFLNTKESVCRGLVRALRRPSQHCADAASMAEGGVQQEVLADMEEVLSEEQQRSAPGFTTEMLTHSAAGDVWDVCPGPGCGSASGASQLCRPHIGDHFPNLQIHIRSSPGNICRRIIHRKVDERCRSSSRWEKLQCVTPCVSFRPSSRPSAPSAGEAHR